MECLDGTLIIVKQMLDFKSNLCKNVERKFWRPPSLVPLNLKSIDTEQGRYYIISEDPYVAYKSVTTVIGEKADRSWYPEWVSRVGQEEANRITNIAARRGQAIHSLAEAYLKNKDYWYNQATINIVGFSSIVPLLNKNLGKIYGLELPLYSHRLKTAGRTDLVCEWNGTNSIVDFKTSRREKLKEQITDYFIQSTCYAMMVEERYGLIIPQICVIILENDEIEPKVFIEKTDDWKSKVEEIFIGE